MEISLSLTTLIFLFVVCLCGGIAIGAMFGRAKKTEAEPQAEKKQQEAELPPLPKSLASEEDVEILRAWRDQGESIWLEMDGKRLENKSTLDAGQKKRLLKLVLDLRPWLDVPPAVTTSAAPAPTAAPRPQVQETLRPVSRPSIFSPRPPKAGAKPEEEKQKVSLKSIVEQIDEVLQQKLVGTIFENREIRLLEGAGGAVIVQIKNERFEGIDAVPDAEIKGLIRQAVAEWEKGAG
jgi:hypothetical protein